MSERGQVKTNGKAKTGRGLLWAGTVVLMGEAAFLLMKINEIWQSSGARTLGWVAAAGTIIQKALAILTWNDGLLLATAGKVLVLCWPLLAIAVGLGLVRSTDGSRSFDEVREQAGGSRKGEQQ